MTATVAAAMVALVVVSGAGARTSLRPCPSLRVAALDRVPLRVGAISCREGDRLVLAWRRELARQPRRCVPSGAGVKRCTLERWRFTCPQTRNGHYWAVTARARRGRGRLAFHYDI